MAVSARTRSLPAAVAVVVPDARALGRTDSLLTLTRWLAASGTAQPQVVCWQTGPLVAELETVAPTIDAGAVNERLVPRALAAIGLRPVATRVKSQLLRRLLEPLHATDHLLLGGADVAAIVDWLPAHPGRHVAAWLDHRDLDRLEEVLAVASAFLAADEPTARALADHDVAPGRIHRVAEPLVAPWRAQATAPGGRIAVAGADPDAADVVPGIVATVLAAAHGERPAVAWVHDDLRRGWARWTDARLAGLEAQVVDWTPEECRQHLDELSAVALLGADGVALATSAALAGVPVVALAPTAHEVAVTEADPAGLLRRLTDLLEDRDLWSAASADARRRAHPHLISEAGQATLATLGLASTDDGLP